MLEQLGAFGVLPTLAANGVMCPSWQCNGETMLYRLVMGSLRFVFRALSVVGVMVPSAQARHPRELIAGSSRRRVWWTTCFIFVVIALGSMSVASTYRVFAHTFDEPAHIAAGMELLDHGSFSYEQLHPPLARLAVALGPYLKGARSQGRADIFSEGLAILYQGGEYQATLVAARLGVLPFLMILIAAASIWAYHDFGAVAAVTTAIMLATTPPLLAHAGLATTDVPVAAMTVPSLFAFRLWLERTAPWLGLVVGVFAALAITSKLSALAFLPGAFAGALLLRVLSDRENWVRRSLIPGALPGSAAGLLGFALTVWLVYGCPADPLRPFLQLWSAVNEAIQYNARGHIVFFLGDISFAGFWLFFPTALLLKTPLPFLVLFGFGVFVISRDHRRDWRYLMPIASGLMILGIAMLSRLDLGIRYVLPVYPLAAMTAGIGAKQVVAAARSCRISGLLSLVLGGQIFASAVSHPDYLPYFNLLAGTHPEQLLVDSDLDWGQDVNRVAVELRNRGIQQVATALHTYADLSQHGFPPHAELEWDEPATGWMVISLTRWAFGTVPPFDGYCWLQRYGPVTMIGKTVRLYYIDPAESPIKQDRAELPPWCK